MLQFKYSRRRAVFLSRRPVPAPLGRALAFSKCVTAFCIGVFKCVLVCAGPTTSSHMRLPLVALLAAPLRAVIAASRLSRRELLRLSSLAPHETSVIEIDQTKEPKKRIFNTYVLEESESDLDSFSDESNESNGDGLTQIQSQKSQKPQLHAAYGPGFIYLSSKKPKDSTSASTVASSQQPPLPRHPPSYRRSKRPFTRLFDVPSGIQTSKTLLCYTRGLKVKPATILDFRNICALLATLKVAYHKYFLKEERELRVLLQGVPKELPIEEVKENLLAQNLPVQSMRRITDPARKPLDLILV
ncbi:hypothetical protein EVAR_63187_1 [Eumeta japonica]|uniref:Uncharacterized protein n=1 Tax=Eumeta variegata TaxID=151549 RepID=A0A4C2A0L9_EUMVA|nr:hypothetical protein EVAR_63187_1 [Eumeta japonica]